MEVVNTLAHSDIATIMSVKSFIVQAPCGIEQVKKFYVCTHWQDNSGPTNDPFRRTHFQPTHVRKRGVSTPSVTVIYKTFSLIRRAFQAYFILCE